MTGSPAAHPTVTRREWRWAALMSLATLVVVSLPYLVGWVVQTPERVFGGCILLSDDCYSYLAKMARGAAGDWLFRMPYTPEPHTPTLLYLFYLLLGKVSALTGLSTEATYHLARVALGWGMMLVVYRFLAVFTPAVRVRRLAWLMVALGGGLGWLLILLGQPNWLGSPPLDVYLPEGFALLVLYGFPHLAAAQTLLLGGMLSLLRAWEECRIARPAASLWWAVLAGLAWFAMGWIVPFYVAVVWAVMGSAWVVLALRRRRAPWGEGVGLAAAALLAVGPVLYSGWVFTTDPVYAAWAAQNLILSPHPLHFLAAYGTPLLLAAFAVRVAWRDEGWGWLALVWVAVAAVLAYLPFNLQRRLVQGVQTPLYALAAGSAVRLWRSRGRWLAALLLAAMLPTTLIILAGSGASLLNRPRLVFRPAGEVAALDWLSERVQPDDVVLAAYDTGNYLPVRVVARVFVGHGFETMDAEEKERLVARFFDPEADDAWRRDLLTRYGVDYVFWGPEERRLGAFDPRDASYLRAVYDAGGYTILEIER
ncbi:MAG TPA: hypothetical protein ENN99_16080 [Chloroflexi bacterium]|nr:hypothetical protein [Chloroflexota bacterium]